jgi:hypothetical protein
LHAASGVKTAPHTREGHVKKSKILHVGLVEIEESRRRRLLRDGLDPLAAQHRKKMVPAARTAETRNPQGAPQKRELALTIFGGNALHVKIATAAAVRCENKSNRHHPSVETLIA